MSDVQYYEYNVQDALSRIEDRLVHCFADPDDAQNVFAAHFLRTYSDVVTETVLSLSSVSLSKCGSTNASWFNDQLRMAARECNSWAKISNDSAVDSYLSSLNELEAINTTQLLGLLHYSLSLQRENPISNTATEVAKKFMGKFEVFGRLFTLYRPDFRKVSENFDSLLNYALLSLVLLILYERTEKLEYLNTALKLNDLLMAIEDRCESAPELAAACAALSNGKSLVEMFYASREFRLPADQ